MAERPILFSDAMVRAILGDRKLMTRRLSGMERFNADPGGWMRLRKAGSCGFIGDKVCCWFAESRTASIFCAKCHYGKVGDKLWVREAWQVIDVGEDGEGGYPLQTIPKERPAGACVLYRATDGDGPWRPSIHMPRWASRIRLEITGIRVEPLQEITNEDAQAEGVICLPGESPRDAFARLWDGINGAGPGAWEKNPWVWVVTFKRVESEARRG